MTRFFLDLTTKDQSLYDYLGDEFLSCESAIEFAEATALFLKNSIKGEWADWSIEVRNAQGEKLFSLPVGAAVRIAA